MHQTVARASGVMTLTVKVDPLRVPRGHRSFPRGGVHSTPRRPNRAGANRSFRRELARESR